MALRRPRWSQLRSFEVAAPAACALVCAAGLVLVHQDERGLGADPAHAAAVTILLGLVLAASFGVLWGSQRVLRRRQEELEAAFEDRTRELTGANEQLRAEVGQRDALRELVRQQNEHYRSVLDAMTEGVVLLGADGEFLDCNPAAERILGIRAERARGGRPGAALWTLRHEDGTPFAPDEEPASAVLRTGLPQRGVLVRLARRDGQRTWLSINAEPLVSAGEARPHAVVMSFVDVTAQREAAEALREREAWFRTLVEAFPHMIWVAGADGGFEYGNARLIEYVGVVPDALLGDRWRASLHPAEVDGAIAEWQRVRKAGHGGAMTLRVRRHDGEYRWFLFTSAPLKGPGGEVVRWVGTLTDVHEARQLTEALRASDGHKEQFLAMLSHELRNPLAAAQAAVAVLQATVSGPEVAGRAVASVDRQVRHMSRLVEDLLDVTRISRGKLVVQATGLDLREVAQRTAEDHRGVFEAAGVALQLRTPPAPVHVHGDPARLAQVIANLLQNAAKFTERGGAVQLAVDAADGMAVVRVTDSGAGFDPRLAQEIFEPFAQAENGRAHAGGGLGLGLALVKGLTELHGGTVEGRSEGEGRGAEFTVRLPSAPPPRRDGARERAPRRAEPRTVLLVEDNPDVAEMLREVLLLDGHAVHVATGGGEAIRKAREARPQVVLCDLGLPDMSGHEVARAIRAESDPGVLLVALTGHGQPDDREQALRSGFDDHRTKPLPIDDLRQLIASAGGPARR